MLMHESCPIPQFQIGEKVIANIPIETECGFKTVYIHEKHETYIISHKLHAPLFGKDHYHYLVDYANEYYELHEKDIWRNK